MLIFNIFIFVLFLIILSFGLAAISFAPWVPTRKKDLPRILKLAELKPGEKFYELGCGNGRVSIYIQKNSSAQIIGLERVLPLYLICKFRQFFIKNKNLIFRRKNLFKENLSDADVVYFFGVPATIANKLKQKLARELKPGAKIISYAFLVEGWQPIVIDKPRPNDISIYVYQIN
ncbi:MAG: hypothetical protein WC460_03455 [Patescibacteria group bacterium]